MLGEWQGSLGCKDGEVMPGCDPNFSKHLGWPIPATHKRVHFGDRHSLKVISRLIS